MASGYIPHTLWSLVRVEAFLEYLRRLFRIFLLVIFLINFPDKVNGGSEDFLTCFFGFFRQFYPRKRCYSRGLALKVPISYFVLNAGKKMAISGKNGHRTSVEVSMDRSEREEQESVEKKTEMS